MKREEAEALLWEDYRRAVRKCDYDPLIPYHPDLRPLASELNAVLSDIQNRMACALQIARDIIQAEEFRDETVHVESVSNDERWRNGVIELALYFGDNVRAEMQLGKYGIHSVLYYETATVIAKDSGYGDIATGGSVKALAGQHLAWLRGEARHLQQFLRERRASHSALNHPLNLP